MFESLKATVNGLGTLSYNTSRHISKSPSQIYCRSWQTFIRRDDTVSAGRSYFCALSNSSALAFLLPGSTFLLEKLTQLVKKYPVFS